MTDSIMGKICALYVADTGIYAFLETIRRDLEHRVRISTENDQRWPNLQLFPSHYNLFSKLILSYNMKVYQLPEEPNFFSALFVCNV